MNGYRTLCNQQALQALDKEVYIPNARLAIGSGEELAPQNPTVHYPNLAKAPIMPDINSVSYERATIDGFANPVTDNDFPKENYFGEAIGGI